MRTRLFIINPAAGGGRAFSVWKRLQPELSRRRLDGDHFVTSRPGEALEVAAQTGLGYRVVVAVGGDGTVFEIVSGLLASLNPQAALAIIPCGTGNDIARNLGITAPGEALAALEANSPHPVDTIAITCQHSGKQIQRHALLFAAAGIIGPQLRFTTLLAKRMLGRSLAYRFASIRALLAYRAEKMRVECDDSVFDEPFLYIGAHNTESFGGGMRIAPGARPDDGLMNVNLVSSVGRLEALRQFRHLCRGTHTGHPCVRYLTAARLSLESITPADIAADGDLIGQAPARFSICPRSLAVLWPSWKK